ncbi:hypothetical protein WN944_001687 [Citrus x changshan-huyou]|uniref:Peptidyl-prolyl cis-trans isomerase CYP38-like PsbQ-like domain-containing protein n=1 Tax=Citrus x changshan-huyou TaxID=2935761 RepID=A0AAP0QRG0_9ROSI
MKLQDLAISRFTASVQTLMIQGLLSPLLPLSVRMAVMVVVEVPRTGELALRRAIPANANMKAIQASLEDISFLLRIPQRKPYGTMEGNVKKALKIAMDKKDSILANIPADLKEKGFYTGGLQALLKCIKDQDPDKLSVGLASSLDTVAELELLQVLWFLCNFR